MISSKSLSTLAANNLYQRIAAKAIFSNFSYPPHANSGSIFMPTSITPNQNTLSLTNNTTRWYGNTSFKPKFQQTFEEDKIADHSWRQVNRIWTDDDIKEQMATKDKKHVPVTMSDKIMFRSSSYAQDRQSVERSFDRQTVKTIFSTFRFTLCH